MPNPAIPPLARDQMPPRWRAAAETADDIRGEATLLEVLAQAPEHLAWYYDTFYAQIFFGGRVERRVKELLRLRLSTLHGCAFCNRGNLRSAAEAGLTEAQIAAIRTPGAACFDERERAVLRLADEMALQNMAGDLDAGLRAELARRFQPAELVELALVAAVLTGMAKMLFVFDLVSREAECPIAPPSVSRQPASGGSPRDQ
jgi:AhpD family alkylhydroperoxidase